MGYRESLLSKFLYKLILWGAVGYLVLYISEGLGENAGGLLQLASQYRPGNGYIEFIAMLGLCIWPFVLLFKELGQLSSRVPLANTMIGEFVYWAGKASADLTGVMFAAMCFVLGWVAYLFSHHEAPLITIFQFSLVMPMFVFVMLMLFVATELVTSEPGSAIWRFWNQICPTQVRIVLCSISVIVFPYILLTAN